jgi:hypothetical protein
MPRYFKLFHTPRSPRRGGHASLGTSTGAKFAERYKGTPGTRLSFSLLNEPAKLPEATYVRVVRRLAEAAREHDPGRLMIADGLGWSTRPVQGLAGLKVAESTHGYDPVHVSHYRRPG